MKKISVVIPVYNSEVYLANCIESIQKQTYPCLEIILVDDGSDDNSLKICEDYARKDRRIKVIHQENSGVSHARNVGIEKATGAYLGFVDSDDFIEQEMYEILFNHINKDTMPICSYSIRKENNKLVGKKDFGSMPSLVENTRFFELCENIMLNSPVNKLYDLEIIKKYNIRFDEKLSLGEDLLFVLEYIEHITKFSLISQSLYNYKVGNVESLSQKYREDFYEIQKKIMISIRQLLMKNQENYEKYKSRFYDFSLDLYLQILNNTFSNNSNKNLKERLLKNNIIMKDNLFKESLIFADLANLNKIYVMLLKTGRYEFVYAYISILKWIKRIIITGEKDD